jgi:hypothetical protein
MFGDVRSHLPETEAFLEEIIPVPLVEEDRVDYEEGVRISSRPQDFKLMVYALGQGADV